MLAEILVCVCLIIIGALMGKPPGWVVVGLAVLALLLTVGAGHLHLG